jgi:hypothetical protein
VRFSLIDSTLPKTTGFVAASILLPGVTLDIVAFNFGGRLTPGEYSVEYDIELATVDTMFGSVGGDTSVSGGSIGTTTVMTNIFDSHGNPVAVGLTSVNGVPTRLEGLPFGLTFLNVRETFIVPFGATLVDAASVYTQLHTTPAVAEPVTSAVQVAAVQVAGPASLILFGVGLVGVSLLRRKIAA